MYEEEVREIRAELRRLGETDNVIYRDRNDKEELVHYVHISACVCMRVNESTDLLKDRLIAMNQGVIDLCQKRIEELQNADVQKTDNSSAESVG